MNMNIMEAKFDLQIGPQLYLADKPGFDRILSFLQPEVSDLTFTNLFMWQHSYGLKPIYAPEPDFWLLFAKPPAKCRPFFLPPVGDWSDSGKLIMALDLMDKLAETGGYKLWLRRIPGQLVQAFQKIDSSLIFQEDRRTFDYVYRAGDLIKLEGRKYHGKRNHLHQFDRKYSWEYQRIDQAALEECLTLDAEWFNIKDALHRNGSDEGKAMAMVLNNYNTLKVSGGVIRVDGKIQAIAAGERLRADMAVIHIEKANTDYEGIYAAINQQFAADFGAGFQFINREEDMGIEGLRKAKQSYYPVGMIEKYSGERNG
jgi:uncharacterized protein